MSKIPTFTIGQLFSLSDCYVIPVYQRNYAWGEKEINQLIQDIFDYAFDEQKSNQDYYIGTLVVYERGMDHEILFETIDGQQRLTTLSLVLSALHREFRGSIKNPISYNFSLEFDSRKKSSATLKVLTQDSEKVQYIYNTAYNISIQKGYELVLKSLKALLNNAPKVDEFYQYLTNKVRIVRVSVPEKTDLNHYFEIMNNRGEQLEKHEILKAELLGLLKEDDRASYVFNRIWEACSDMERYVQYGFSPSQRDHLFGNVLNSKEQHWAVLNATSFEEVCGKIYSSESIKTKDVAEAAIDHADGSMSILDIIGSSQDFAQNSNHIEEAPERFTSVVNFPNFLLHVLRILTRKDISLDDKRLLSLFDEALETYPSKEAKIKFVHQFGFALLKCKFLFDHYIIKREFIREKEQWSLKRLKWYKGDKVSYVNTFGENSIEHTDVLMLLAMFHVSTPTMVYKHWLNAALLHLYDQEGTISSSYYKKQLENLAKAYVFDRYLKKDEPVDFYDIIYKNDFKSMHYSPHWDDHNLANLDCGTYVENFIFNYLDYILWVTIYKRKGDFEFTSRSSVEHYYPRNPIAKEYQIDPTVCDMFGNLCLISQSKNSRLSNLLPSGKKDFYKDSKVPIDSLKQKRMMRGDQWAEEEIKEETKELKKIILNF